MAAKNAESFRASAKWVVGDEQLLDDPIISSIFAGPELLSGLPPLLIEVGSAESILGDSALVAQQAAAAEVEVVLDIYEGMWHVFPMYSEGCGTGEPLWEAQSSLHRAGLFVRRVAQTGHGPCDSSTKLGLPATIFHSRIPGLNRAWLPEGFEDFECLEVSQWLHEHHSEAQGADMDEGTFDMAGLTGLAALGLLLVMGVSLFAAAMCNEPASCSRRCTGILYVIKCYIYIYIYTHLSLYIYIYICVYIYIYIHIHMYNS